MKRFIFLAAFICGCSFTAEGALTNKKKKLYEELLRVPVPELAARATQLVRSVPLGEREETAVAVLEIVLSRHPAAAVAVVSALSKAAPEHSATVVDTALRLSPAQTDHIVFAAQAVAPVRSTAPLSGSNLGSRGKSEEHRNGGVSNDPILPNGKPRHVPSQRPPHPVHPPHPPKPIKYNQPHEDNGNHTGHHQGKGHEKSRGQGHENHEHNSGGELISGRR